MCSLAIRLHAALEAVRANAIAAHAAVESAAAAAQYVGAVHDAGILHDTITAAEASKIARLEKEANDADAILAEIDADSDADPTVSAAPVLARLDACGFDELPVIEVPHGPIFVPATLPNELGLVVPLRTPDTSDLRFEIPPNIFGGCPLVLKAKFQPSGDWGDVGDGGAVALLSNAVSRLRVNVALHCAASSGVPASCEQLRTSASVDVAACCILVSTLVPAVHTPPGECTALHATLHVSASLAADAWAEASPGPSLQQIASRPLSCLRAPAPRSHADAHDEPRAASARPPVGGTGPLEELPSQGTLVSPPSLGNVPSSPHPPHAAIEPAVPLSGDTGGGSGDSVSLSVWLNHAQIRTRPQRVAIPPQASHPPRTVDNDMLVLPAVGAYHTFRE